MTKRNTIIQPYFAPFSKKLLPIIFTTFLFPYLLVAQLDDDFSDGDFTQNPAWVGETSLFQINNSFELQSNGPTSSDTIYLATANTQVSQTEWRFDIDYAFGPSTTNNLRVYLTADQSDLEGPINGYYLKVGESGSNDSYDLYRQDGNSSTLLIDGIDGKAGSTVDAAVKVVRDNLGNWSLFIDQGKVGVFELEGSANDNTYTTSAFFGIWIKHTSTRNDEFFFDNFYIGNEVLDTIPPKITAVNIIDNTTLEVVFNEFTEINSAENTSNYLLNPGMILPSFAIQNNTDQTTVELSLASPLSSPNTYELIVSQVEDWAGNSMTIPDTVEFDFIIPETAVFKDVIINEIFPDPTPSIGLPDAEFIELWNRSNKLLDLTDWTIDNGTTTGSLPISQLAPGEYMILTTSSAQSQYSAFGTTISPSSWTTLVNGGDNLGLRSSEGMLIDSVDYQSSWYNDPAKQNGGYSIELINPENLDCPPIANWVASQHISGGTPGGINSAFSTNTEQIPPSLVSTFLLTENILEVCFNEPMNLGSLGELTNYQIDQGIGNPISINPIGPDNICAQLTFNQSISEGIVYTLSIENLADCSGNLINNTLISQVVIGEQALKSEVVITEIFADFSPSQGLPEAEFVEIYNRTDRVLDISNFFITDRSKTATLKNVNIYPNEYLILCANEDTAEFSQYGRAIGLDNFPLLGNSTDSIFLVAPNLNTFDYVYYSDDWYRDNDKREGGWTLEKIDPDFFTCNNELNWAASNDPIGGTPGSVNSVDGEYQDNDPPKILNVSILNENEIKLLFNEPVRPGTLENPDNYNIDQGIGNPLFGTANNTHYSSVELFFTTPIDSNRIYIMSISGLFDCSDNELVVELALGIPVKASENDILLNEILFDPYTGGSDFVEIANVSDKVLDLQDIRIGEIYPNTDSIFNSDPVSQESRLFLPGELICLTADVSFQQLTYLPDPSANLLEMNSFPTYDDSRGEVVIYTNSGIILDQFEYQDTYHYPTLSTDEGVSLERISLSRSTLDHTNWHSAGSNVRFATPGYKNSQGLELTETPSEVKLEYQTFTPNDDGDKDVLPINYNFDFQGANARVTIFDSQGRKIKELQPGNLLTPQPGTYFWDGTNSKNQKADVGMYIILFEVVNQTTGDKMAYKLVAVLGDRF